MSQISEMAIEVEHFMTWFRSRVPSLLQVLICSVYEQLPLRGRLARHQNASRQLSCQDRLNWSSLMLTQRTTLNARFDWKHTGLDYCCKGCPDIQYRTMDTSTRLLLASSQIPSYDIYRSLSFCSSCPSYPT